MIKDFERGIISFSDYLAEINVLDKYKEKYSWVKSIIIYHIPYSNVTYYDNYLPAKFAYSTDYHKVIKEFLEEEAKKMALKKYEVLVDVNFINEKVASYLAGMGSVGKNQLLISKRFGTFFNIGTIVTDEVFNYNKEIKEDLCLNCNKCIKSCPNHALDNGYDKNKCLSFLTQSASKDFKLYDNMVLYYGCDACQDACPYNKSDRDIPFDDKSKLNLEILEQIDDYKAFALDKTYNWIGYLKMLRNILVLENKNKNISKERIEYYQNKHKDVKWFYDHLEYLKNKLGE